MLIAITGHKGFLGKHLVAALRKKKNCKLRLFDLGEKQYDLFDIASLKQFVRGADAVVHLAAVNRGSPLEIIAGNVVITHNLAEAVRRYNSSAKIIYTSSVQAESNTFYGRAKRISEEMLEDFSKKFGISTSVFRFTNIFGEGGAPFYNSVVTTFCFQAVKGLKLLVNDPKKSIRFLYQKDAVDGICREIFAKRKNLFYFRVMDSRNDITVGELARIIKAFAAGKKPLSNASKFERDLFQTFLSYVPRKSR